MLDGCFTTFYLLGWLVALPTMLLRYKKRKGVGFRPAGVVSCFVAIYILLVILFYSSKATGLELVLSLLDCSSHPTVGGYVMLAHL